MTITNRTPTSVQSLAIQLNKERVWSRASPPVSFPTADNELCLLLLAMSSLALLIPVSLEVVFTAGATMEVAALATAWKGIEDSQEASVLVIGAYLNFELSVCACDQICADH
jgi:hypothetical protein